MLLLFASVGAGSVLAAAAAVAPAGGWRTVRALVAGAPTVAAPAAGSPAAAAPPLRGQDETPAPLSVMTFNIRTSAGNDGDNGWVHRRALVAQTIERLAPDVAGLQEALDEQVKYLADALPGYRWLGADRGLNGGKGLSEYTPIFYRREALIPIESGTFWLSPNADGPTGVGWRRNVSRIVTWARFHHRASGRRVHVFNTHLTLRRGQRQVDSAKRIAARVAALPAAGAVVVTGDFNALAEISETWSAATGQGLRDAWLLADERIGPPRTSNDFRPPELANPGRIDWILVGGPVGVRSVQTIIEHDDGRYPSDHYPVVAQLLLLP
ncbi:MAG: endonuclease/exonuclease/phosphatase family protein [Acidobacteria bacterium]|nr:endonuclease/exonuclease/phosphatase family protein [Acidobacteriota bacterium]